MVGFELGVRSLEEGRFLWIELGKDACRRAGMKCDFEASGGI